jgi:copper chaperone CopZ
METKSFGTNLTCGSCVATVTPFLKADPEIAVWSVDTNDERKLLTVSGEVVDLDHVRATVQKAGFKVFEEIITSQTGRESNGSSASVRNEDASNSRMSHAPMSRASTNNLSATKSLKTYFPLILILFYLLGFVAVNAHVTGDASPMMLMNHFMGGFFVVFSFFKILNLKGFVDSYVSYDVVAKKVRAYAYLYPFIELALGVAYLAQINLFLTNVITAVVMAVSSAGVIASIRKKENIRCACLGTIFNLPMSTVTLVEDFLMLGMAILAIVLK